MDALASSLKIEILLADKGRCNTTWNHKNVNDPFARFYFVTAGQGMVGMRGKKFLLIPGSITVIPANTLCELACTSWFDVYWIHCTATVFGSIDFFSLAGENLQVLPQDLSHIEKNFERFLEIKQATSIGDQIECEGIFRQLLAIFYRASTSHEASAKANTLLRFRPALDYIAANLHKPLSTGKVAACLNLQPTYFANLFSYHFGVAPQHYIQQQRIEQVKKILGNGNDTLKQIAQQTGFSDEFHLSKVFKKIAGFSPRDFKRRKGTSII